MAWLKSLISHVAAVFQKGRVERELSEELRTHIDMLTEENLQRGMPPQEARYAAMRTFGGVERVEQVYRERMGLPLVENLVRDGQYGFRQVLRDPFFCGAVIVIVALGITATCVVFNFAKTVVLGALPYRNPSQIIDVSLIVKGTQWDRVSPPVFLNWQENGRGIGRFAATAWLSQTLVGGNEPEQVMGDQISEGGFQILGVRPLVGRGFVPLDYNPANPRVIVLSFPLWQRLFDGRREALSGSVTLDGVSYSIIGVMPAGFFTSRGLREEYWIPLKFNAQQKSDPQDRFLDVTGRLNRGVSLEQARSGLEALAQQVSTPDAKVSSEWHIRVVPAFEKVIDHWRSALVLLFGAAGLLLLIACVNVANLLLARAASRQREIAVRVALGAWRRRVVLQLLTESVILAGLGGAVGVLLSIIVARPIISLAPARFNIERMSVDPPVLLLTLALSALVGIGFGLVPAFHASKVNLADSLKEGGYSSTSGRRRSRTQAALVVAEVALSLVLLIGAGLMLRSFLKLEGMNPGFRANGVLTLRVVLPKYQYPDKDHQIAAYRQLLEKMRSLPGVQSSGFITPLPLGDIHASVLMPFAPGMETYGARQLSCIFHAVSAGYFRTMEIPLLGGRYFTRRDDAHSENVVIVNQAFARRYWPGKDPVGKQWRLGGPKAGPWTTVVGVVGNAKDSGLEEDFQPVLYQPFTQYWLASFAGTLIARTRTPASTAALMRREVHSLDPNAPVFQAETMERVVSRARADKRLYLFLVGIFAVVALMLAAAGIASVVSFAVSQRRHEIGIRMALGAERGAILRLIVGQTLKLIIVGVAFGLAGSFILTRFVASELYKTSPTDPMTLVLVSLILTGIGIASSLVPASKATRVDPAGIVSALQGLHEIFNKCGVLLRQFSGLLCLTWFVLLFSGCRPAAVGNYRLEKIRDDLVLAPPPYWNRSKLRQVTLQFAIPAGAKITSARNCSIKSGPFRFYAGSKQPSVWTVFLPSIDTWHESIERDQFGSQFEILRSQIGEREAEGCFPLCVAGLMDEAARESVPVRIGDTLLYQYSDERSNGFIDLEPGMRAEIERAVFNAAGKFQGTDTAHYRITRGHDGAIQFHLTQFKSVDSSQTGIPDLELTTRVHSMTFVRLFLTGDLVPRKLKYAAVIIGTRNQEEIQSVTNYLEKNLQSGCMQDREHGVDCVAFQGEVIASVLLAIWLNGRQVFVEPGTTLRGLLSDAHRAGCLANTASLSIERKFLKRLRPVKFNSKADVANLILLAGDHVKCGLGVCPRIAKIDFSETKNQ